MGKDDKVIYKNMGRQMVLTVVKNVYFNLHKTIELNLTFDKDTKLFSLHSACSHLNLQSQQESEQEFVCLVQATTGVFEDRQVQILNDVVDTLAGDGGLDRFGHGQVKEFEELLQ